MSIYSGRSGMGGFGLQGGADDDDWDPKWGEHGGGWRPQGGVSSMPAWGALSDRQMHRRDSRFNRMAAVGQSQGMGGFNPTATPFSEFHPAQVIGDKPAPLDDVNGSPAHIGNPYESDGSMFGQDGVWNNLRRQISDKRYGRLSSINDQPEQESGPVGIWRQ